DKAPVAGPVVPQPPPAPVPEVPPEQRPEGDNVIWVPGYWGWDAGRNDYVWVSGCWRVPPPGRNWVPGYWTQADGRWQWVSGFWDGYRDYPLDNRGLLFAPVCFNGTPWTNPGWCYRPSYCVGLGGLLSSLWVGPSRGCYFFGDHFGPRYRGLGFTPWYSYGRGYANPLFGYYRWANRGNPGWYSGLAGTYRGGRARASLVQPLGRLARGPSSRLAHVNASQFNHYRDSGQRFPAAGR